MPLIRVPHPARACDFCAKEFVPKRKDAIYCSYECKRAYWKKVREAGKAAVPHRANAS